MNGGLSPRERVLLHSLQGLLDNSQTNFHKMTLDMKVNMKSTGT